MSSYGKRLWGGLLGAAFVCAIVIAGGFGDLREGRSQGLVEILVVVGAAVASVVILSAVFWTGGEEARNRKKHLVATRAGEWLADVRLDSGTIDTLAAEPSFHAPSKMPKDFAFWLGQDALEVWAYSTDETPTVRIPFVRIKSVERSPAGDLRDASGDFVLELGAPDCEITGSLVGPFWGGYPASPTAVDRVATILDRARHGTP